MNTNKSSFVVRDGKTKTVSEIELKTIDKTKPFFKILLYVDKNSISTTKLFEKTGNKYTYSTTSLIPNANVPDASFIFDTKKYGGSEATVIKKTDASQIKEFLEKPLINEEIKKYGTSKPTRTLIRGRIAK